MNKIQTYRKLCCSLLAIHFLVFSAGIPVVLAACPMMSSAATRQACCVHAGFSHSLAVHSQTDNSCCKIRIVADRNKTDAISSPDSRHSIPCVTQCFMPVEVALVERHSAMMLFTDVSPPLLNGDLPLLHASLLL